MKRVSLLFILIPLLVSACSGSPVAAPAEPPAATTSSPQQPAAVEPAVQPAVSTAIPTTPAQGAFKPVEQLVPLAGAVLDSSVAPLSWEVVPGASSYRVQVATDRAFEDVRMEYLVTAPPRPSNPLAAGDYFWRVQAIAADGSILALSGASRFQVHPPNPGRSHERGVRLDVPYLHQGKDSTMLLLESPREQGMQAWNRPHPAYDPTDPADSANSALACAAMLNHYYGGDLTQDRIGYEIYKNRQPGPEGDLPYGAHPTTEQVLALLGYALGSELQEWPGSSGTGQPADFQDWAKRLVDRATPVIAASAGHYVVIIGYELEDSGLTWWVNDPAAGVYRLMDGFTMWEQAFAAGSPEPAKLENSLLLDRDRDGVLDFDEIERFHTNPLEADSDGDGILDETEIRSSVMDPHFGYAQSGNPVSRDPDQDGLPFELDSDSDNGGCLDSFEDADLDGMHDTFYGETSNFDPADDQCYALRIDWSVKDDRGESTARWLGSFRVGPYGHISGVGVVTLHHNGNCIESRLAAPFSLSGMLTDPVEIQIQFSRRYRLGEYSSGEIKEGCTTGMAIEENWLVTDSLYAGIPLEFQVPADWINAAGLQTLALPENAPRPGDIQFSLTTVPGG